MQRRKFIKLAGLGVAAAAVPVALYAATPEVTRYAEVVSPEGWKRTRFQDLKQTDVFRLFEQDGTPADDGEVSVARGDAYIARWRDHPPQWTIQCDKARADLDGTLAEYNVDWSEVAKREHA